MDETAGRGRGRGRGGVPVLPEGMWDALQGNSDKQNTNNTTTAESFLNALPPAEPSQYEDAGNRTASVPMGFGRGRGDFGGRGGRGGRSGRGGIERDAKGKDWECPSCTNVNWSWRSNCNKCNTAKPASILTEAENRDGAGKGFNERQERISASTVEIDEEGFDDFGRRVKKEQQASSRADRRAKEEAALARMNEKYKHLIPQAVVPSDGDGSKAAASSGAGSVNHHSRDDTRTTDSNHRDSDRPRNGDGRNSDGRDDRHARDSTAGGRDNRDGRDSHRGDVSRRDDSRDRKRPRSPETIDRARDNNDRERGYADRQGDRNTTSSRVPDRDGRGAEQRGGDRGSAGDRERQRGDDRAGDRGRDGRDERGGAYGRSSGGDRDNNSRDNNRDKYSRRD